MDSFNRRRFTASIVAGSFVAVGIPTQAADVWTPPENPDPSTILREAKADTAAGRYDVALAKHVWYHENALRLEPAQYGVRLSFALADWMRLAEKSPPALAKLKEIRDAAGAKVVTEPNSRVAFHAFDDFESISTKLNEEQKVCELFSTLRKDAPEKARAVYLLAEPALIRAKKYAICGEYIDAEDGVRKILMRQETNRKFEGKFGPEHKRFAEQKMTNQSATLVALLAVNDRQDEAEKAAAQLKEAWDDKRFHAAIDKALAGIVPAPWP